jgi:hypothetical protein
MVNFDYFLQRKYQLLQQQANTGDANAQTARLGTTAAAGLDNARARVLPAESAANIAQTGAQTRLIGEQASVVRPVAMAGIGLTKAQTGLTRTQDQVEQSLGVERFNPISATSPLGSVLGGQQPFRLSGALAGPQPTRRRGETEASWLDRINGL